MVARPLTADVLVVGGGPAGSSAAIACAKRGLRVVLVERDAFAQDRPGETLHPGAEPLLTQLGIVEQLASVVGARHAGIWVEWGGPRRFEPFGADSKGIWNGIQVKRPAFDGLLLHAALAAGVEVRQPAVVIGATACVGGWDVETSTGQVIARIVLDASGRSRWLSRLLSIASPGRSRPLIARYGYVEGSSPDRDIAPLLLGEATGWTWTSNVRQGVYQWIRVSLHDKPVGAEWRPEEFRSLRSVGPARGADVTWRIASNCAGEDWYLIGDAAAILDPTSSHGVLKALMSGMMTAHLVGGVLDGTLPAAEAAAAYQTWMAGWFATDIQALRAMYALLDPAWSLP